MSIFARRPIDLARLAAAVASEAGWQIERWDAGGGCDGDGVEAGAAGAEARGVRRRGRVAPGYAGEEGTVSAPSAEPVSIVVTGGELPFPARVTITAHADGDASGTDAFVGIRSEHVPRTLPPPDLRVVRAARARGLVIRLVEHPMRGTLDDALARADGLAVGEAVTVLAAVARGLADLHEGGRAGVLLAARCIGFRDDGCPILTGIDRLRPLDRGTAREDLGAFAELAATVCSAVRGARAAELLAASTAGGHRSWDDVIAAVLRAADPIGIARPSEAIADSAALGRASRGTRAASMNADAAPREAARGGADPNTNEPAPVLSSWDLEATVLRDDVRAAVSALPRGDAPGLHGGRIAEAPPRDGGVRDAVLTVSGGRSPVPEPAGWESAGRVPEPAVWERGGRKPERTMWDGGLRAGERAESDGGSRQPQHTEWNGVATSGSDRALGAAERVLHEVGDRPIARLVGAARAWAAERPLLVGIALVPLVGVLLALVLVPADGQTAELVGKSSSALLRGGGTGPNR